MNLVELDPHHLDAALFDALHECCVAIAGVDDPDEPLPQPSQTRANLYPDSLGTRRTWVAVEEGTTDRVLARMRLALADPLSNPHLCDVAIEVHPAVRRSGLGRRLLEHAVAAARADGRTVMTGAESWEPGRHFATAMGAELALEDTHSVLDVAAARAEATVAPGYRLVRWVGRAPETYVASFATVKESMSDAPLGDLDMAPWRWDASRVRNLEDSMRESGRQFLVVVAVHEQTGEVVALTEMGLYPEPGTRGDQHDTVVIPAHRGHGLGLAIKAEMIRWLHSDYPQVHEVETWNASANEYMLAVNRELGFKPRGITRDWQLRL